jgi:hypothetical protein
VFVVAGGVNFRQRLDFDLVLMSQTFFSLSTTAGQNKLACLSLASFSGWSDIGE